MKDETRGKQGQTEGCWRCDGNRTDLRWERYSGEQVEQNGLCQRSISDPVSNKERMCERSSNPLIFCILIVASFYRHLAILWEIRRESHSGIELHVGKAQCGWVTNKWMKQSGGILSQVTCSLINGEWV